MTVRPALTLVCCAALGAQFGCDNSAADAARDRAQLSEAVTLVDRAEQGYTPQGSEAASPEAYRRDQLGKAAESLRAIADNADSPSRARAQSLLAKVHLSTARAKARDAATAFAQLRARNTGVTRYLSAVGRVDRLIQMRATDTAPTVEDIAAAQRGIEDDRSRYTAKMTELSLEKEQATERQSKAQSEADRAFAEARQLQQRADAADDPAEQRSLIAQAYQARRRGEEALNRAQLAEIEADNLDAQLQPLQTELDLYRQMSAQLDTLRDRVQKQGAAADTDVSAARSLKGEAVTQVSEQYRQLSDTYTQEVAGPLDAAAEDAQKAVMLLQEALQSAKAREAKAAIEFDLLAARVEEAAILTRHADYARTFARIASAVADNPALQGVDGDAWSADPPRLTRRAEELTGAAKEAIEAGELLLGEDDTNPIMAAALDTYRQQLNEPAPDPAADTGNAG